MYIFASLAFLVLTLPCYASTHLFSLNDQINSVSVVPGIVKLSLAKKGDYIVFHLNSPGGDVYAGEKFLEAMEESEGISIAYVDDYAASMAAFIAIKADRLYMSKTAVLLFHVISSLDEKNNKWVKCTITEMNPVCTGAMSEFYSLAKDLKQFVSEKEYQDILNGKDVIVNAQTLAERSKKVKIYN